MAIDLSTKPKGGVTPAPLRRRSSPRPPGTSVAWSAFPGALWRRKGFVLGFVVVATGLMYAYLGGITPRYEAEALVTLEGHGPQPIGTRAGAPAAEGPAREMLPIESRALAARLVDELSLHLLPEFNAASAPARSRLLDGVTLFRLLPAPLVQRLPDSWIDAVLSPARGPEMTDVERAEALRNGVIEAVSRRIEAAPGEGATIVRLRFRAADPERAALAANALAEGYLEERREQTDLAIERAAAFLSREIERLQERISEAEAELQAHRQRLGLDGAEPAPLARLASELGRARGERAAVETRLRQAARLLAADADLWAATDALDSPTIVELHARGAELRRRKAGLTGEPDLDGLTVGALEAEEAELARLMREEVSTTVEALRAEIEAALVREADLQSRLIESRRGGLGTMTDATGDLRALQRRAEGDRALLEIYLTRAVELRSLQGAEHRGARILSRAATPGAPSYPPRTLMLGATIGLALVAGSVVALGLERMDDTFRSGQQLEEAVGLPALGWLPAVADAGRGRPSPEDVVLQKPNSPFGEAVRSLRTALLLPRAGAPPRVLLVTSAVPGEGRTSVALSLARANASAGHRTLLIEADLRRPRLRGTSGVANGDGLSELVTGSRTVDQVLRTERSSGLSIITAGASISDPAALFATERMRTLLESLSRRFELIVLDGPPLLGGSDAGVLAQLADKAVFLVRWGHTRRRDAVSGVRQLTAAGADVAGVVPTRVNARRHARYG